MKQIQTFVSLLVGISITYLAGCKVTMERVQKWKKKKDYARLQKCLTDKDLSTKIRTACGFALFDLGKSYGVENMLARVAKRSSSEAAKLAEVMAKHYLPLVKDDSDESVRAKDALFVLRSFTGPELRRKIDEKIVRWYVAHYTTVATAGEHSAKKVFKTLGAEGAEILAQVVPLTAPGLYAYATQVRQSGSSKARDILAGRIVALLKKEPSRQGSAEIVYALGQACGKATVPYLENLALHGMNWKVRRNALIGLQLCPAKSSLKVAASILKEIQSSALSGKLVELPSFHDGKAGVVGQCYNLLETVARAKDLKVDWKTDLEPIFREILSARAQAQLSDKVLEQALLIRYQGAEYAIYLGKLEGLKLVFEALPPDEPSKEAYVNAPAAAAKEKLNTEPLRSKAIALAKDALKGQSLTAKIVAIKVLGALGTKKDADALSALTKDRTPLPGWPQGKTLGMLAASVKEDMASR